MRTSLVARLRAGLLLCTLFVARSPAQTVVPALDAAGPPGARPYEMVWANRREEGPPTVRFDDLRGWTMRVSGGAEATLQPSRAQNVWDRPVGRLRYRGTGSGTPSIVLAPPQPVPLPPDATVVEMWVWGNRWDFVNPPGTPPVRLLLHLRDATGRAVALPVDTVRWEEWWLLHRQLPAGLTAPLKLEGIEAAGGWQADWREIFLDSIRFYHESPAPLHIPPRPRRNLTLWPGQSPGANSGPGRLPFPTREQTILPAQLGGAYRNGVAAAPNGAFDLTYSGRDAAVRYRFTPAEGLAGLRAWLDGAPVGRPMDGAVIRLDGATAPPRLRRASLQGGVVTAAYDDGTTLRVGIRQKSLVIDVANSTGHATELAFGQMTELTDPHAVWIPYMTYGGTNPSILRARAGRRTVFASLWPDWYRSNGSELYGAEYAAGRVARINGGVRYQPRTDGRRNALLDRLFLTVSPRLEETLPTCPNPVGLHARQVVDRLWQESWGPDDYAKQMARSRMLRAYGIEKLIQCNHEIAWRDGGESFTVRLHAAPKKGGDEALQRYVAHQRSLGWYSGLYTNYTDFAPVNGHWTSDLVQRQPDGEWRSAWPRCWALKPLRAVELDALLAPQIEARYRSNSAYTDVHTAVAPWAYTDYDARLPGAGTFAQTFYAYGELLRNDSRVYGGPIFSEGTYQWLYAGLADGNYALAYNGRPLANEPLLPVYDLYQIHPRECDIGMAWTGYFCDAIPNWHAPENLDRAIDRFLLHTLAYGHIGWLVEEEHGIARTCRSYYMLQQVQARYGLQAPVGLAYWDGARFYDVSEAVARELPRERRQLYVVYPSGLQLWLNDHPREEWRVRVAGREIVLPPAGWAAWQATGKSGSPLGPLLSFGARVNGGRVDYLRSAAYIYQDGRGRWFASAEAGSDGALAITRLAADRLQVLRLSGTGPFLVRRPYGMRGPCLGAQAFDVDGRRLAVPVVKDSGTETWVEAPAGALRCVLRFAGRVSWHIEPGVSEAPPGARIPLWVDGPQPLRWEVTGGAMRSGVLEIPEAARVGDVVAIRAHAGGETRETRVRVGAPLAWDWHAEERDGETLLTLRPDWRLKHLVPRRATITIAPPAGWSAERERITVDTKAPPRTIQIRLRTAAASGAEGTLRIAVEGLPGAPDLALHLRRAARRPVTADLVSVPMAWGIARRGEKEGPDVTGSGAQFRTTDSLAVGGLARRGLFMHPPYNGGVGYTWAESSTLTLPAAPTEFHAFVGLQDGGDPSDGVMFRVEVVDAAGARHRVAEAKGVQREWRELRADLAAFAGQQVRLRLVADVGPADNSAADWACWGEPAIQRSTDEVITEVETAQPER